MNFQDTNGPNGPCTTLLLTFTARIKKNWQALCHEFQKTFDNQQLQTQAKLLLESITRSSGEKIITLALRFGQMTRKTYVNKTSGICNAQMNDALVNALDPQLA